MKNARQGGRVWLFWYFIDEIRQPWQKMEKSNNSRKEGWPFRLDKVHCRIRPMLQNMAQQPTTLPESQHRHPRTSSLSALKIYTNVLVYFLYLQSCIQSCWRFAVWYFYPVAEKDGSHLLYPRIRERYTRSHATKDTPVHTVFNFRLFFLASTIPSSYSTFV